MSVEELKRKWFGRQTADQEEADGSSSADRIASVEVWLKHPVTLEFFERLEAEIAKHEGPVEVQFAPYACGFRDCGSAVQRIRRAYERFLTYEQ